jgi:hypothetical protein
VNRFGELGRAGGKKLAEMNVVSINHEKPWEQLLYLTKHNSGSVGREGKKK